MRLILLATAALLAVPASASTVLFSQNFDSVPAGIPQPTVPGFTITGTVDIVDDNTFNIRCVGNAGRCLDIDGTPGPGAILSNSIAFAAGQQVIVSFDLSGNQRNGDIDPFTFDAFFAAPTDVLNVGCSSGFPSCASGDFVGLSQFGPYSESIPGARPWVSYSFFFTPVTAGTLQLSFGSASANNVGPVIDNVLVSQAAVPEPQSWAMLIAGFGLVGAASRRKAALAA